MDSKLIENSMSIILHAGDARKYNMQALEAVAKFDYEEAELQYSKAKKEIVEAHKIQTMMIQGETQGEKVEYSVLFAHAQDTLMTIYSELNVSKNLQEIFKSYEQRITRLEEQFKNKGEE